jgi:hypothetical protein
MAQNGSNNFSEHIAGVNQDIDKLDSLGAFGGNDPRLKSYAEQAESSLGRKKFSSAKDNLNDLSEKAREQQRDQMRALRDRQVSRDEEDRFDKQKLKMLREDLRLNKQIFDVKAKDKSLNEYQRKIELDKIKTSRSALEYERKLTYENINARFVASKKETQELRTQQDIYEDIYEKISKTSRGLDQAEKRHQGTFGYHLGNQRVIHRALQYYGNHRIQGALPTAMGGQGFSPKGLAIGGLSLGAGVLAEQLLDQFIKAFTRNFQFKLATSEIFKGTGGGGQAKDFTQGLRDQLVRYGLSREEIAEIGKAVRPMIGQMAGGEYGFRQVMEQGVSLDKAFGSPLGSGGIMLGDLIRKTPMSKDNMGQFSLAFSEALGKSGMIGLQEEQAKGVIELVELTRKGNIFGADPTTFARMIGNLGASSEAKGVKGIDAANILANISQGVSNPQSETAQLVSIMALRKTVAGSANAETRSLAANGAALLNLQPQGLGLSVGGESLGESFLKNTLESIRSVYGLNREGLSKAEKDFRLNAAKSFMYQQYGVAPEAGGILLNNPAMFDKSAGSVLARYGLGKASEEKIAKPGGAAFTEFLSEADKAHGGTSQEALNEAITKIRELNGINSGKIDEAVANTKGKSLEEQANAVFEAAAASPLTEADKDSANIEEIKNKFEEWANKVLTVLEKIATKFGVDLSDGPKRTMYQKFANTVTDNTGSIVKDGLVKGFLGYDATKESIKDKINSISNFKPSNMSLDAWAKSIQEHEGFTPGSMSFRNNNPGNLTGEGDAGFEWDKNHTHKFRKFSTLEKGMEALKQDLRGKVEKYPDYTILQIMNRYLGGTDPNRIRVTSEGDPFKYAQVVAERMGLSVDTKLKDIPKEKMDDAPKQTAKEVAANGGLSGDLNINYTHTVKDPNGGIISQDSQTTPIRPADLSKKLKTKTSFGYWGETH